MNIYTLTGAHVLSPKAGLDGVMNLTINGETGTIQAIGGAPEGTLIDCTGKLITPGFIDLHVHLRDPGQPHKETIQTGTAAAHRGGYTTVVCMPNTSPAIDTPETITYIKNQPAMCEVLPCGAITKGILGEELTPHGSLVRAGAAALSDDGRTTMNEDLMREAFRSSKRFGVPVMTHSEDHKTTEKLKGQVYPASAENDIVARDIRLLREEGGHLHVSHVSTKEAAAMIASAKEEGLRITGEAAPHHFGLSTARVDMSSPYSKVNPPIRSEEDRLAIVEALRNGTLDAIATDHAPHEEASKTCAYADASFGISGIETAFAVTFTELVLTHGFSLNRIAELLCEQPAEILGRTDLGVIREGAQANLAVLDLDYHGTVDASTFVSQGKNTPFQGKSYQGRVAATVYQGKWGNHVN